MKHKFLLVILLALFCGLITFLWPISSTTVTPTTAHNQTSSPSNSHLESKTESKESSRTQTSTPATKNDTQSEENLIDSYVNEPNEAVQEIVSLPSESPPMPPSTSMVEHTSDTQANERALGQEPAPSPTPMVSTNNFPYGRVGGIRAPPVTTSRSPTPSPSASPKLTRLRGQARGFTMLYLMHPHARAAVEKKIEILKKAEINEVYLGVLTDGTFTVDYEYLNSVIGSLVEDGRTLTLVLYLTNGATMRKYDTTPIDVSFNTIDPTLFRDLIQHDDSIRARFRQMAQDAVPTLEYNLSLNPLNKNYIIVMLEDNLDADSYLAMRSIAQDVIGSNATFMRNPCPGDECWEGNDMESFGDPIEYHTPYKPTVLNEGDGYSLDGKSFNYETIQSGSTALTISEVKNYISDSQRARAAFFGLWRAEFQGIENNKIIHPSLRNYEVPTSAQAEILIDLLRTGLTE